MKSVLLKSHDLEVLQSVVFPLLQHNALVEEPYEFLQGWIWSCFLEGKEFARRIILEVTFLINFEVIRYQYYSHVVD